jgi:hypothetical protein
VPLQNKDHPPPLIGCSPRPERAVPAPHDHRHIKRGDGRVKFQHKCGFGTRINVVDKPLNSNCLGFRYISTSASRYRRIFLMRTRKTCTRQEGRTVAAHQFPLSRPESPDDGLDCPDRAYTLQKSHQRLGTMQRGIFSILHFVLPIWQYGRVRDVLYSVARP